MSGFSERLSNLPPGVSENDPDAPWNQKDPETKGWFVVLRVWVEAVDEEDACEQVKDMAAKVLPAGDYEIEDWYEEP